MAGVEALDARTEERADRGPLRREDATRERKPDARVQPPQRAPHATRQAELDHRHPTAGLHDSSELPHRGRGIVDVAQEIREGEVVERRVRKRQLLRAPFDDGLVDAVSSSGHRQHVRALIDPDHRAAVSIVQRLRDHAGARRDIENAVRGARVDRVDRAPAATADPARTTGSSRRGRTTPRYR